MAITEKSDQSPGPRGGFKLGNFKKLSGLSLYLKVGIIIFVVFVLTIVEIAYQLENRIGQTHIEVIKEELRSIAAMAAVHINGDLVEQLQKPADEASEAYHALQKELMQVKDANRKIDDIYIMRKSDREDQLAFVLNAFVQGTDHVALGETYDLAQAPDMLQGFIEPTVDRRFSTDKWGQMLSGYAPVKNSQGKVVGIVGIDFMANNIKDAYRERSRRVLFHLILGMVIVALVSLIVTNQLIRRLNKIKNTIDMLLEEKFNVSITDHGKDEIEVLALRVNKLIKKMVRDKEQMFIHSTTGLVKALEARDFYTHGHSSEVALITEDIMNELQVDLEQQFTISFAAVLHDIGKIGIPDLLLHKPGKLTEEEYLVIKQHPVIGEKILEGIPSLEEIRDIVRHHHERYDGKGYPDRLAGEAIHFGARIIAVADSFQAMISDRPYREGMTQAEALRELEKHKGTQFDPKIVEAFLVICHFKKYKTKESESNQGA